MTTTHLLTSIDNGIARITFNRPEVRNALSPDMLEAMIAFLLLALKVVLVFVFEFIEHGANGASIGHVFGTQWLFMALAAVAVVALRWFARPQGAVDFDQRHAIDVESMGLYWHFVDIVWIVIFTAVYLLEYL